jgi:hypothetical protein
MTNVPADQLVDVHAHFVTDSYIASAKAAGHLRPDGMPDYPSWSVEDHLALMAQGAIQTRGCSARICAAPNRPDES